MSRVVLLLCALLPVALATLEDELFELEKKLFAQTKGDWLQPPDIKVLLENYLNLLNKLPENERTKEKICALLKASTADRELCTRVTGMLVLGADVISDEEDIQPEIKIESDERKLEVEPVSNIWIYERHNRQEQYSLCNKHYKEEAREFEQHFTKKKLANNKLLQDELVRLFSSKSLEQMESPETYGECLAQAMANLVKKKTSLFGKIPDQQAYASKFSSLIEEFCQKSKTDLKQMYNFYAPIYQAGLEESIPTDVTPLIGYITTCDSIKDPQLMDLSYKVYQEKSGKTFRIKS